MKEKTKNPFAKFGRWCVDTGKWLVDMKDWKMLFRSIPSIAVGLYLVAIVMMNLWACKSLLSYQYGDGPFDSATIATWGIILSWIPFLVTDVLTKVFGAKASIKLSILGLVVNLGVTLVSLGICELPIWSYGVLSGDVAYNTGFEATGVMHSAWYICLASSIAFIVSAIVNAIANEGIGKLFKKNPDGRVAFMVRSYSSTMIGQYVDNFLFTFLAFGLFNNISNGFSFDVMRVQLIVSLVAGLVGALFELLVEVIFSPIGYRISRKWVKDSVGKQYLDYCKDMELKKDLGRFNLSDK